MTTMMMARIKQTNLMISNQKHKLQPSNKIKQQIVKSQKGLTVGEERYRWMKNNKRQDDENICDDKEAKKHAAKVKATHDRKKQVEKLQKEKEEMQQAIKHGVEEAMSKKEATRNKNNKRQRM